jgi:hypothetical protein
LLETQALLHHKLALRCFLLGQWRRWITNMKHWLRDADESVIGTDPENRL